MGHIKSDGRIFSTIGERLLEERRRLGLSQSALSAHGGVTKHTQINYEKDGTSPTADYLAKVEQLGADVLYVVTGRRSKPMDTATWLPSEDAREMLGQRGITFDTGAGGLSQVLVTPVGLAWLLNLRLEEEAPLRWQWGQRLIKTVVEGYLLKPRVLNVQLVTLRPYESRRTEMLSFYLDKSQPSVPFSVVFLAGLAGRNDLAQTNSTLPIDGVEAMFPEPVLALADDELERLRAGEICRYSAD